MTPRIDSLDRNFLINGNFEYFQRALTASTVDSANAFYAPDRWANATFNQAFTVRRSTSLPAGSISNYSLEYNTVSPIGAADRSIRTRQRIESVFAKELSNKEVSFKCSYKSESATQFQVVINSANVKDDFTTVTEIFNETVTILNDGNWGEYLKEALSLGDVSNGVEVLIWFKNTALLVGNVNHNLADIKLSIGTKAQEFSLAGRNQVEELSLCQRYFEKSYNIESPLGTTGLGSSISFNAFSGTEAYSSHAFKVTKRVTPTVSVYGNNGTVGQVHRRGVGDVNATISQAQQSGFTGILGSSVWATGNTLSCNFAADAEL